MNRHPANSPFTAALTLCTLLLLTLPTTVLAARNITSVTIDSSSSIPFAGTVDITVNVTTTNRNDWDATHFEWSDGTNGCMDHEPDHDRNGSYSERYTIPGPSLPGTWDLVVRASGVDECNRQLGGTETVTNAATVVVNDQFTHVIDPNPDLIPLCGIDMILVLDASGSIGKNAENVRNMARAFLNGVINTGSRIAIVEFSYEASIEIGYTNVTQANIDAIFEPYLRNDYRTGGGTNWDHAFMRVEQLNDTAVAPLVVFMTDGDPSAWWTTDNADNGTRGGTGSFRNLNNVTESYIEALPSARDIQKQGSHMLMLGVGAALQDSGAKARLRGVSGPDLVEDGGDFDIKTADVSLITDFDKLEKAIQELVFELCAPSLTITKLFDPDGDEALGGGPLPPAPEGGREFTVKVEVSGDACNNTNDYEWQSPPPLGLASIPSIGITKTAVTGADGTLTIQWTPGNLTNPKVCNSTTTFIEDLDGPPKARFRSIECTCKELTDNGFVEFECKPDPNMIPPDKNAVIDLGPSDLATCTVINDAYGSVPVTLGWFQAMPGKGGINFAWQTATETGNLGFNLYVHEGSSDKGGWQRINDELIPSRTGDSVSTREYSYQASGVTGERFKLGDVDRNNRETRHGPFVLGEPRGVNRAGRSKTNWKAIRAENEVKDNIRRQQRQLKSQAKIKLQLDRKLDAEEKRAQRQNR